MWKRRNRKKINKFFIICLAALGLFVLPVQAAERGSDSLTAHYKCGGALPGVKVELYRVADMDRLTGAFSAVGAGLGRYCENVDFSGVSTAKENEALSETLAETVLEYQVEADFTAETNKDGEVFFSGLQDGLYLLSAENPDGYETTPALVSVPQPDEADGGWISDVAVYAKVAALPVPQTPETPRTPEPTPSSVPNAKTGDNAGIRLWGALTVSAAAVLTGAAAVRRKKKKTEIY